jgi:predicted negative regulator of RcsB-dependent stress response
MQEYSSTAYAVFAALQMAQSAADNNDLVAAKDYLSWVITNADLSSHQELARLRLAGLMFSEGDNEQALALALVNASKSTAFSSLFAELEGDIQLAMGNKSEAHSAYQRAVISVGAGEPRQMLLQMKIDDVAATNEG